MKTLLYSEVTSEEFYKKVYSFRFVNMKAAKLCLSHIDGGDRFLKYRSHNDYLEVSCIYWNKCPFHLIIENDTAKGFEGYVKVGSYEAHDHSLTRERLFREIDMTSPIGPLLYRKKCLELEMADLERIETRDRKRKKRIIHRMSNIRNLLPSLENEISVISAALNPYNNLIDQIKPFCFDNIVKYEESKEMLAGLVVIARGMWIAKLEAKSFMNSNFKLPAVHDVTSVPVCNVNGSLITWNVCPHDCTSPSKRQEMIVALYRALNDTVEGQPLLLNEGEENEEETESEEETENEEGTPYTHQYNTRRRRVDYVTLNGGMNERSHVDRVTFTLEKIPVDMKMNYPIYMKLYYCLRHLYFVQHPPHNKCFKAFSRSVRDVMRIVNQKEATEVVDLQKILSLYAGATSVRREVNRITYHDIEGHKTLIALCVLGD